MNSLRHGNLRLIALAGIILGVLVLAFAVVAPGALAAPTCLPDAEGANDEPGQKDLTQVCTDYGGYPELNIVWQWDDTGSSGANSLDACSLFDSDGDGNANYALCASTTGSPATLNTSTVYTCNDANPDRCSGYAAMATPPAYSCEVASPVPDDPFTDGDEYPNDAVATCSIDLSGFGESVILLDVCSYPSNPGSDPSDCIVRAASGSQLIVRKITEPPGAGHIFDFEINTEPVTQFTLSHGASYATAPDLADGVYTITEVRDAGENDWTTSIECDNGVSVPADANTVEVTLAGSPVTCVFTNTAGPVSVNLASFTAESKPDHILLSWETVTEVNNLGFNVFRADTVAGPRLQVNAALIPSANPGSTQGASYSLQDFNVVAGNHYVYWLEDLDTAGTRTLNGPVKVQFVGPTSVGLNSFTAAASSVPALLALGGVGLAALAGAAASRRKRN